MSARALYPALRAKVAPALPVERLVLGQRAEDAADLLPRLFNLCRTAQSIAARAAFGLPLPAGWQDTLRAEITREHLLKLCVKWPNALGLPHLPLPIGQVQGGTGAAAEFWGEPGHLPETPATLDRFLRSRSGIAPVLAAIRDTFAPGQAVRPVLTECRAETLFNPAPQENSCAARHADHPVMREIEAHWGRGPLWSAFGVAYDLERLGTGWVPAAQLTPGCAVVPAARGLYGVEAEVRHGQVLNFRRVTPTDHLLASGGGLEHALRTLNAPAPVASVLLSVLDPCHPVELEASAAPARTRKERAHA